MIEYEQTANQFCDKHGIVIHADFVGDGKCPPWCDDNDHIHGDHYFVSLMRKDSEHILEFDYWNSFKSMQAGERPSNYEILATVNNTAHLDPDPAMLVDELGVQPDLAYAVAEEAWRFHCFLSAEELEDLCVIR